MSESPSSSCQHKTLCSCHNTSKLKDFILHVKNKIERCMKKYMSLEETGTYLQDNHQITPRLTRRIWEHLQKDSPEFFKYYYLRCETASQKKIFNNLLARQLDGMLHINGDIGLCNAQLNLLQTLNKQQNQLQHYPSSAPNDFAFNQLQIPIAPQSQLHHLPLPTPNVLAGIGAPTVAQAVPAPSGPSTFDYGGDIGHSGLSFSHMDTDQLVMQSENLLPYQNGQYQPPLQLPQNFSMEEPTPKYGSSIDQQSYHNFDPNQSMQTPTRFDRKQALGITPHHPEVHELRKIQLQDNHSKKTLNRKF